MSGRRRYRPHVRDASAVPILATAGWGASWGHLAGFLALGALAAICWPVVVLFVLSAPGAFPGCLVTRRARVRYRKRRMDESRRREQAGLPPLGRGRSGYMPKWFRTAIGIADRWRCVNCGSRTGIQWDHKVPWACGGLTVLWNVALLCQPCNGLKSCYYPPWDGYDPVRAPILQSERKFRPLRWLRLAWAL